MEFTLPRVATAVVGRRRHCSIESAVVITLYICLQFSKHKAPPEASVQRSFVQNNCVFDIITLYAIIKIYKYTGLLITVAIINTYCTE